MIKTLTATVLATSIALTGLTAPPAQAANDDFGKLLAGVATLFIIGKAIESNSKPRASVTTNRSTGSRPQTRTRTNDWGYDDRRWQKPGRHKRQVRRSLPAECLFRVRTRDGRRAVFGERCLDNRYRAAFRLPEACKDTVRTRNGRRSVYGASCLRSHGYRVEARRH